MTNAILTATDGRVLYPFGKPTPQLAAGSDRTAPVDQTVAVADGRSRALTPAERVGARAIAVLTVVLGVLGLAVSFHTVAEAAEPTFGPLAWTVPAGIDLAIAVFSGLDLLMARLDMRVSWLRLIPAGLVAVTIYLNVAHQATWFGRIAHAVLPGLWVVAVEVATHAVRVRAGLASGRAMDSIRLARWLLAPLPTAGLWRRMKLWEIRAYPDALERERARLLAKCALADTYGMAWRWRAPRRLRALYRLGELDAEHVTTGEAVDHHDPADRPVTVPVTEPATEPAAEPAAEEAIASAGTVGTEAASPIRPRPTAEESSDRSGGNAHGRSGSRSGGRSTVDRVASARRRSPRATQQQIADRLGLGVRTVGRYWSATGPAQAPAASATQTATTGEETT